MAAIVDRVQRNYLPLAGIGLLTGLLALIPNVGWLLGALLFLLGWHYLRRTAFLADSLVVMAIWLGLQWAQVSLFP